MCKLLTIISFKSYFTLHSVSLASSFLSLNLLMTLNVHCIVKTCYCFSVLFRRLLFKGWIMLSTKYITFQQISIRDTHILHYPMDGVTQLLNRWRFHSPYFLETTRLLHKSHFLLSLFPWYTHCFAKCSTVCLNSLHGNATKFCFLLSFSYCCLIIQL